MRDQDVVYKKKSSIIHRKSLNDRAFSNSGVKALNFGFHPVRNKLATQLPKPRITIPENKPNFDGIIQTFQNLSYIGEMRQRWEEIKKLKSAPFGIS